jgi:hypothetical protein
MNTEAEIDFERLRTDQDYRDSVMMLWITEWATSYGERRRESESRLMQIAKTIR